MVGLIGVRDQRSPVNDAALDSGPGCVRHTQLSEHLTLISGDSKLSEAAFVGRVPCHKRPDNERSHNSRADVIAVGCYRACQIDVLLQLLAVGVLECIHTGLVSTPHFCEDDVSVVAIDGKVWAQSGGG